MAQLSSLTKAQLIAIIEKQKRMMCADTKFYSQKYNEWQEERRALLSQIRELKGEV